MPTSAYFTLDSRGILTEPTAIVDARLTDYFYSVRSQDPNFISKSLIYDLAVANNDPEAIRNNIQASIESLLNPYFEETTISVSTEEQEGGFLDLSLGITVVDNGVTYNIGRDLKTRNSKLMEVSNKIYAS